MFDQSKDEAHLIELNSGTFHAEERKPFNGQPWDTFLQQVLSEDFWIRRANSGTSLQNRDGMIAHVRASEIKHRTVDAVSVKVIGDYGIVTCIVMVQGCVSKLGQIKRA